MLVVWGECRTGVMRAKGVRELVFIGRQIGWVVGIRWVRGIRRLNQPSITSRFTSYATDADYIYITDERSNVESRTRIKREHPTKCKAFNFEEHSTVGILLNLNASRGKESATSMKGVGFPTKRESIYLKLCRYHQVSLILDEQNVFSNNINIKFHRGV